MITVRSILFLNLEEHCRSHGHNREVEARSPGSHIATRNHDGVANRSKMKRSKVGRETEKGKDADRAVLGFACFVDTPICHFSVLQ